MITGFFLGLSVGPTCLATCLPAMVPVLIGEERGRSFSAATVLKFLGGRFIGYLLFGLLAWFLGNRIAAPVFETHVGRGAIYLGMAAALAIFCAMKLKTGDCCAAQSAKKSFLRLPVFLGGTPTALGLLTGLSVCPPFVVATTEAAQFDQAWRSMGYFVAFFLGTSLYFLPTVLLGEFTRFEKARIVARLCAATLAVYYAYLGLVAMLA